MARNQGKNNNVNWGICTNTSGKEDGTPCSKCQNKEKQAIRASKEFVCEECKEPLTRIAPPPPPPPWALIIGIAVVVIGLGVGGYFFLKSVKTKKVEKEHTEYITDSLRKVREQYVADSLRIADSLAKAKKDKVVKPTSQKWKGVATYEGPMQGGKPHGIGGTLKFNSYYTLDLKDGNGTKIYIKPGESIHNVKMDHGALIQGELHRNDGTRPWINIGH